jgi:transposase-like protein
MSQDLFKRKHFKSEVIILCVRRYLKYPLSYRMLVEMIQERGLKIKYTTIVKWVHQYSPLIDEKIKKCVYSCEIMVYHLSNP